MAKSHINVNFAIQNFDRAFPNLTDWANARQELKIKCEHCHFLSDNQSILKLHALSHQISLVDIMKNLPPSIKEASFKTEDEFKADLKIFLDNSFRNLEFESLASNQKVLTVECTECGKRLS